MHDVAVLNVVGLTKSLIGEHTPHLRGFLERSWYSSLQETFPAVTCTSQATMLTGLNPEGHGIVGNGWYFKELAEVGFWKQNNGLVQGEKIFENLKSRIPGFTCAKLFWWYNMYSAADWSVTPRPHYPADGRKVFDIYTHPFDLKDALVKDLGSFPFLNFWGPGAGIGSSQWIAACARWIYEHKKPALNLVYLPHLDYGLQKYGPDSEQIIGELKSIDQVVGELIDFYEARKCRVLILSEYGISAVKTHSHPNRILRKAGFVKANSSLSWELLDCGASEAFAVADHQICHIYVKNKARIPEVVRLFEKEPGQQRIIYGADIKAMGLAHARSGDIILMANPDHWYTYYYWEDDALAPDFARCVDIHRKPGYDPVELFLDPDLKSIKMKVAWTLLKKKLGFRYYMDVIPLKPDLVKGSHGTPANNEKDKPLVISNFEDIRPSSPSLAMTSVRNLIADHVLK